MPRLETAREEENPDNDEPKTTKKKLKIKINWLKSFRKVLRGVDVRLPWWMMIFRVLQLLGAMAVLAALVYDVVVDDYWGVSVLPPCFS